MSLLTEDERNQLEDDLGYPIGYRAFDAIEAAILAKLASAELPEPAIFQYDAMLASPIKAYTADQLRQAYAQGAAAQLAEKPSVWAMRDALDELSAGGCVGFIVGVKTDWRDVPLYTRRQA